MSRSKRTLNPGSITTRCLRGIWAVIVFTVASAWTIPGLAAAAPSRLSMNTAEGQFTSGPSIRLAASPTADDALLIAEKVQASLLQAQDVEQVLHMAIINPDNGHSVEAKGRLRVQLPHLFRLDFTEPDMLEGVAVLVDLANNEARQYQPVTEQIIIQPWDQLARERGMEFDIDNWLGLPDPEQFHLRRGQDRPGEDVVYIVLEGRPRNPSSAGRYEFLIHPTRWWVEGVRLYDANDVMIFSVDVRDVTLNQGLTLDGLRQFPAGVDTIYR